MAAFVGKLVAKKIFKEKFPSNPEHENPYYERVPTRTLGFKHMKRSKKPLPPGLTKGEEKILKKAKARAYALDMAFIDKGPLKLGWSSLIGLVPGFGDVIDLLLAVLVYRTCCAVEPPLENKIKNKMMLNLIIDFVIGLVPVIGDLADAAYKCNTKNVILLEDALVKRAKAGSGALPAGAESRNGDGRDMAPRQNQLETSAPEGLPPRNASTQKPRRAEPAYNPHESKGRGGFLGGRKEVDLEAGEGRPPQQPPRHQSNTLH